MNALLIVGGLGLVIGFGLGVLAMTLLAAIDPDDSPAHVAAPLVAVSRDPR